MKTDIDNTFIRYGRLHITKQKAYGTDSFHAPPASKGFYAMPIRFQELFLIGSIEKTQPDVLNIPKKYQDTNNNSDIDYDAKYQDYRKRIKSIIHKFIVKNDEFIWHHLDVKRNLVVNEHNDWVKTTVYDWKVALAKESLKLRTNSMSHNKNLQEVNKKSGFYSKDHFEVFFDYKVC
ncbi:hypothetical protein M0Q50_07400 [bacterium]|jgi:hypothetical protein|nr:hypothetical protein [bacterium]